MAKQGFSIKSFGMDRFLQLFISLLFICMGIIGFVSNKGLDAELSREISHTFGNDQELLVYVLSTVELLCGIVLGTTLFVKAIPDSIIKIAMNGVWVVWLAIIILLDLIFVDFGNFDGVEWFVWIEELMLHLIVFVGILQIKGKSVSSLS